MKSVGIHEAKTHLSQLLRDVEAGEEVEIRRGAVPVARIVAATPHAPRQFGVDRGVFTVPDDFDAPLPDDLLDAFER
jgi:prevent-host-death family protein